MRFSIAGNFVLTGMISAVFGPLFVVPGAACVTAAAFLVSLRPNAMTRRFLTAAMCAAVFVPAILEWTGVVPPSMAFEDGTIRLLPRAVWFPSLPTHVLVALLLVYVIWSSTYLAMRFLVHEAPPLLSGGVRYVIAGTILLAILRARGVLR